MVLSEDMDSKRIVDLSKSGNGTFSVKYDAAHPDDKGVVARYALKLPRIRRGVYYQSYWWPAGGNRVYPHYVRARQDGRVDILEVDDKHPDRGAEGGVFAIFEKADGDYVAVLPLAGSALYAWLSVKGGEWVPTAKKVMK
ncbi:MAG: hypothetical protein D6820_13915, partial [Lentisphaerae bacterium]